VWLDADAGAEVEWAFYTPKKCFELVNKESEDLKRALTVQLISDQDPRIPLDCLEIYDRLLTQSPGFEQLNDKFYTSIVESSAPGWHRLHLPPLPLEPFQYYLLLMRVENATITRIDYPEPTEGQALSLPSEFSFGEFVHAYESIGSSLPTQVDLVEIPNIADYSLYKMRFGTESEGDDFPDHEGRDSDGNQCTPFTCGDGDGFPPCAGDCNNHSARTYPGAPEVCDGHDNDCGGEPIDDEIDNDGDGQSECRGDCNDSDEDTFLGSTEDNAVHCVDDSDNDCDGLFDREDPDCDAYFGRGACDCEHGSGTTKRGAAWLLLLPLASLIRRRHLGR